ncbi:MAG: TonB-dependent receptor [Micavibrio sp.]|nr:TonB-dependent receptor [Micavibrio sp.]
MALTTTTYAQSVAPTAPSTTSDEIQEVVVTAEKRPSTVQKTPIAITVVDAATLSQNGVGNFKDLSTVAPSVSFSQLNASVIVGIRGVSSRDIGNPAVSLSMDGFYTQQATGLNGTVFDLDRVEVLRGPQGTLLGRNATGGSVDIITAKPKKTFSAYLSGEIGDYNTFNTTGMINIPVSDKVQVRASFQTRDHDGYRGNPVGDAGDDEHSKAARVIVAFQPTDRWEGWVTAEYSKLDDVGPVVQAVPLIYTSSGSIDLSRPTIPDNGESFAVPDGGYELGETMGLRWSTTYNFDFAQLTYLGGYRYTDYERNNTLGGAYGTDVQNITYYSKDKTTTWNQELRLTSESGSPLFWQVGAFYFYEHNSNLALFRDYAGSSISQDPINLNIYSYPNGEVEAKAIFGQIAYNLTDALKVEVGARYTENSQDRDGFTTLASFSTYLSTGEIVQSTTTGVGHAESSKATYHGGISWQATSANLLYAKIDTGFKAGGFNTNSTYAPETIIAYEIGSKNRFFSNRLQVNADAFFYTYDNQQVSQFAVGAVSNSIINAGSSEYYGVEFEGQARPTPIDRFNFFAAYVHGEYKDFAVATGSVNVQLAGYTPPQAPRWTVNLGYEHDFNVFKGVLTGRAQTHYETKSYFTIYNYEADSQPAYFRSDVILTYKPNDANWRLEGYVRNIENVLVLSNAQNPASATYKAYRYQYFAPRTMGVKLTLNW